MIDGTTGRQSILWLTPLREIEVLTALRRLTELGVIELRPPNAIVSLSLNGPFEHAN